ncbi:MAG: hypothetical protein JWP08_447 [Bryobacterales bacterium]|nr:hypothetical protein [Bryobacterales bacterium]
MALLVLAGVSVAVISYNPLGILWVLGSMALSSLLKLVAESAETCCPCSFPIWLADEARWAR